MTDTVDDAITERIPLPRTSADPAGRPGPTSRRGSTPNRRRVRLAVVALLLAVLAVGTGALIGLFLLPPAQPVASAGSQGAVTPPGPAPIATPAPAAPTTSAAGGSSCPSAQQLVEVFRRAGTGYGAGARPTIDVTCASGFAVVSLRSSSTPDGVQTIYALGPPVRFLAMGTGSVCSDSGGNEEVVVPDSAAERLGCVTSSDSSSAGSSQASGTAGASGADPYGCLAERAAQERSYDTDDPMSNAELRCNYNYGPTLPSTREQCWLADHDRDEGYGPPDERGRRDFEEGCSGFGY